MEQWQTIFSARANIKDYTERDYREMVNDLEIM
jgi:hypothetical protein